MDFITDTTNIGILCSLAILLFFFGDIFLLNKMLLKCIIESVLFVLIAVITVISIYCAVPTVNIIIAVCTSIILLVMLVQNWRDYYFSKQWLKWF